MKLTYYDKNGNELFKGDVINEESVATYTEGCDIIETPTTIHYINKETGGYWILQKNYDTYREAFIKVQTDVLEEQMGRAMETFRKMCKEMAEAPSYEMYGTDAWLNLESLDTALSELLEIYRRVYNTDPSLKEDEVDALKKTLRMVNDFLYNYEE